MAPVSAWPVEGIRQALRALATSVKTRRLGLCVVPCEVVRVCGRHGAVSGTETRAQQETLADEMSSFKESLE